MELPYDKKTQNQIQTFYKLQKKDAKSHRISEDGLNLNTYSKEGSLLSSIPLKAFRPLTPEEEAQQDEDRLLKLAALDVIYEAEMKGLREALAAYKTTGDITAVVLANEKVATVSLQRQGVRSAVIFVEDIPIPNTRDVLFDEPYETRKLFGAYNLFGKEDILSSGIFQLRRHNFPSWKRYGRYGEEGPAAATTTFAPSAEEGHFTMLNGSKARIFYDPANEINGFLSPLFEVEFVYKETKYSSAYQAFEAIRMLERGKTEVRASLLKTRSVRAITAVTQKIKEPVANPAAVWKGILTALYQQHPELVEKLLETAQDTLIYANPDIVRGGVGLSAADAKIVDPSQWKGVNVVGQVLEALRAEYREESELAPPTAPVAKESVISKEQQEAAKTAAILRKKGVY